ncbi:MAG TPA: DciA family protein [Spirochaetales bacterium]|nr:DciA family protein [Spirochaetales bacterium]HPB65543.1 DciA family protein [Spirochaetales bacterium]HPM72318.1 DciA family protein [Spirochaetales bacterium]HQO65314.1 DciA family protein [Spirochaetales bacterium]
MDDSRVRKASDLLGALLSPEAAAKADTWSKFFSFWNRAAGENLAAHSRPVDLRNGIVFVEATHPGWIQLLQMRQTQILATIRRSFPDLEVSGIAFRLAKDPSLPGTAKMARPPEPIGAEGQRIDAVPEAASETPSVSETIGKVEDESFRSILSSLAETLGGAGDE